MTCDRCGNSSATTLVMTVGYHCGDPGCPDCPKQTVMCWPCAKALEQLAPGSILRAAPWTARNLAMAQ